jgi:hypothetical protein
MTNPAAIDQEPAFIEVGEGDGRRRIAVRTRAGGSPGLFWLGGFNSDMRGTKALALDEWAAADRRACVRFDIPASESGAPFIDGTIGLAGRALRCSRPCRGPQVDRLVDGGWMATWRAPSGEGGGDARRLVLLTAPAPDC